MRRGLLRRGTMSKNDFLLCERLDVTTGRMRKGERAQTTRVLRDDELDAVSGGLRLQMATSGFRLADRSYLETMSEDSCNI
jgi:hypothetical protein